ncbi:hypothetical protein ACWDBW_21715 [Streptomyces sp. NPDC001107]
MDRQQGIAERLAKLLAEHRERLVPKATATADHPVAASILPWTGDPEILGVTAPDRSVTATTTARNTMTATTQPVDPGATASTGAFWDHSARHDSLPVAAGKTGTMTLTLAPTAPVGTVVHGILSVDNDTAMGGGNGSEITGIPYTYTVG